MSRQAIGAAIRARREATRTDRGRPLSQEKAAAAIGVSRETWRSWENGKTLPDLEQAVRVAGLLGCEVGDLLVTAPTEDDAVRAAMGSLGESGTRRTAAGTGRRRG